MDLKIYLWTFTLLFFLITNIPSSLPQTTTTTTDPLDENYMEFPDPLENYELKLFGKKTINETCNQQIKLEVAQRHKNSKAIKETLDKEQCSIKLFLTCETAPTPSNPSVEDQQQMDQLGKCQCSPVTGGKYGVVDKTGKCRIPANLGFRSVCEPAIVTINLPLGQGNITAECTENSECQPNPMHVGKRCYCQIGYRPQTGACVAGGWILKASIWTLICNIYLATFI